MPRIATQGRAAEQVLGTEGGMTMNRANRKRNEKIHVLKTEGMIQKTRKKKKKQRRRGKKGVSIKKAVGHVPHRSLERRGKGNELWTSWQGEGMGKNMGNPPPGEMFATTSCAGGGENQHSGGKDRRKKCQDAFHEHRQSLGSGRGEIVGGGKNLNPLEKRGL